MIAKLSSGSGFAGVLSYAMGKDDAEVLTTCGLYGDQSGWAREMRQVAAIKNIKSPVLHASLAIPPGQKLADDKWQKAAGVWMEKMGIDPAKHQYVLVRHNDQKHDHVHLIINRVALDGKVLSSSNERWRSHQSAAQAAIAVGLEPAQKHKTSQRGLGGELRRAIDKALPSSRGLADLRDQLRKAGIEVIVNQSQTTGRINGISYQMDGHEPLKGSSLGKEYSLAGLQKRGLELEGRTAEVSLSPTAVPSAASQGDGSMLGGELRQPRQARPGAGLTDSERRKRQRDRGFEH